MSRIIAFAIFFNLVVIGSLSYLYYRDVVANEGKVHPASCVPYNHKWEETESGGLEISWKTSQECSGYVRYTTDKNEIGTLAIPENGFLPGSEQVVKLSGLARFTTYYIFIYSEEVPYGDGGVPIKIQLSN